MSKSGIIALSFGKKRGTSRTVLQPVVCDSVHRVIAVVVYASPCNCQPMIYDPKRAKNHVFFALFEATC